MSAFEYILYSKCGVSVALINMAKLSSIATTNDETSEIVSYHIEPAIKVVLVLWLISLVLIIWELGVHYAVLNIMVVFVGNQRGF